MKLILIVIDGMGDLPSPALGGKTPLEAAKTSAMDRLASKGKAGLMLTVGKGIAPESDVAVISLLGYDPFRFYTGRGPLEAIGSGIPFRDGELAMRCNFATINERREIVDRRAGRDLMGEESGLLAQAVQESVKFKEANVNFTFRRTIGHRGVLVIRSNGMKLSPKITNTDPAYSNLGGIGTANRDAPNLLQRSVAMDGSPEADFSAALVNEFVDKSHEVLKVHEVNRARTNAGKLPGNVILTRDAGDRSPQLHSLSEKYRRRFVCLADMPVERAISKLAGMDVADVPPPSANIKEDCLFRVKVLRDVLDDYDCFYIHMKGPDEPGHDGDAALKSSMLEAIDRWFVNEVIEGVDLDNTLICLTADHSTPCSLKGHSDDPVPLIIAGGKISGDGLKKFSEKSCARGSLGLLQSGTELMPTLMKYLD